MLSMLRDIWRRRELVAILVGRNLKIRYKNSALGFFWSLLAPLFMILIYALFLRLMRFTMDLPMLVTGIIVWQFLAMSLGDSLHAIVGNANLVTKSNFPRVILPASTVLANFVNFLLSSSVLLVYLLIERVDFGPPGWLLLAVGAQLALVFGIALLFSATNVFFRDTEHIVSMVMLAWFFTTPVIYPDSLVLDNASFIGNIHAAFFLNPMTGIVTLYRMALLSWPNPGCAFLTLSLCSAAAVLLAGLWLFWRVQDQLGDEL